MSILYDDFIEEDRCTRPTKAIQRAYRSAFLRYKDFCVDQDLPYLPAQPEIVSHYLIHLGCESKQLASLKRAINAIKFFSQQAGMPFEADDILIRATFRWITRRYEEMKNEGPPIALADEPTINGQGGPH